MCKAGILLLGLDLYLSTSSLFKNLILHDIGSPLDLAIHMIALTTLLLTYRGSVKRSIAGKVVLPVMALNTFKQLMGGNFVTFVSTGEASFQIDKLSFFDNPNVDDVGRLMVVKSLFLSCAVAKLAFQGDDSCVGEKEWFPWQHANVVNEEKKKE